MKKAKSIFYIGTILSILIAVILIHSFQNHTPQASDWMIRQINRDFSRFTNQTSLSQKKIIQIAENPAYDDCLFVHFSIQKNKVSMSHRISPSHILAKEHLYPRMRALQNSLQQTVKKYPLPDMDFIISIHDALHTPFDIPIFVMAKTDQLTNQILIPDFTALRGQYQVLPSQDITKEGVIPSWEKRKQQLIWRGGPGQHPPEGFAVSINPSDPHCLSRVKLCYLSTQYPEIINAKFSFLGPERASLSHFMGDFVPYEIQLMFKYQMLIDGFSCSYSTSGWRLFSGSLIFKEDSKHIQWYYNELKPYEHYVPVKEGLEDLIDKLKWAMTHDEEAKKIARQAREFALSNLTQEKNRLYLHSALVAYSKLNWVE